MTQSVRQRDSRGARGLEGGYFTSDRVLREERETVFRSSWLYHGTAASLSRSGDASVLDRGDESALVVRGEDGVLRAFHNHCRHRGARLCDAGPQGLGSRIRCPYHGWTYDLEGALVGAPNMAGVRGFDPSEWGLVALDVGVWEGLGFVRFGDGAETLDELFSPLGGRFSAWRIPELEVARETTYRVRANWKLIFQNYSECYHCPALHPALNRLTPYRDSDNDLEEGPILGGPMRLARPGGSMSADGRRVAPPLGDIDGAELDRVHYYTIFPSLFLSIHPDYVLLHDLTPLAPDLTVIRCQWLFHPEAIADPGFDPQPAVEFWDLTNRQDWEICERTQHGVASAAFSPGPYADLESVVAAFDRHYLAALRTAAGPGTESPRPWETRS